MKYLPLDVKQQSINQANIGVRVGVIVKVMVSICLEEGIRRYQKGRQTEFVNLEDIQDHGQQSEKKDKHRTHNTTLNTKAGVTRPLE